MIHFLACIVFCLPVHSCHPSDLEALYSQSNRTYFANRLPKHPRFVIQELGLRPGGREILASTIVEKHQVTISISPRFVQKDLASTMIHKQCHVLTWSEQDEHGPEWKACMETRGLKPVETEQ